MMVDGPDCSFLFTPSVDIAGFHGHKTFDATSAKSFSHYYHRKLSTNIIFMASRDLILQVPNFPACRQAVGAVPAACSALFVCATICDRSHCYG